MPGIDYRQVRSIVSMSEVLSLIGFAAAASTGKQLRGPCPLHGSGSAKSRVFSVNLAKNTFQCFKCKAAGNQLDIWAAATKQALYDAAIELCRGLNRPIPWLSPEQRRGTRTSVNHPRGYASPG